MVTRAHQPETRQETLAALRCSPEVSVLVIGGGINGIGVFRDLALQGVDVLLVERGDFCSGASAASSHMVHGGIRYLENGEFRLVREAVRERNRLLANAPHLVRPLPTVIPLFHRFSGMLNAPLKFLGLLNRPSERGALVIKIGLLLYDAYTRFQGTVPRHRVMSRRGALQRFPALNPSVIAAAVYYDAVMPSPERLALEVMQDGEAAGPRARALNYMRLAGVDGDAAVLSDELSGEALRVRPGVVVNAAGPWIDFTNRTLGRATRFIGGTKGSHLVLDHVELQRALGGHEFFFENEDGRIVLLLPLRERVLVGTSDLPIDDPDAARLSEEEVDYFLRMAAVVFPGIRLERRHIVFAFSGVRPLPAGDAASPGQISRDHSVRLIEPGEGLPFPVFSLVGGKWTTFRAFAEQAADRVLEYLGRSRVRSTESLAIGGGRDYPDTVEVRESWMEDLRAASGLPVERLAALFERYGTKAEVVAGFIAEGPDAPLESLPGYSRREVAYLARREKVVHLDDLLLRRTGAAFDEKVTRSLLVELADIAGAGLGWTAEQRRWEVERAAAILAERHGVVVAGKSGSAH